MRFVILLLVLLSGTACAPGKPPVTAAAPTLVGRDTCASCHTAEVQAWAGSHHDLAMEEPTVRSVRGRFDGATFEGRSGAATFLEQDGKFLIRTAGMDRKPADFPVSWTFGVAPLQQYLLPFPGGRFQAFGVAWDDRPAAAGGQRWYDLYPDQDLKPGDPLHWTGLDQTWN